MITEMHSMEFISFWLDVWRSQFQYPNEVVVDESSALIGACVKTFAKCTGMTEETVLRLLCVFNSAL